MRACISRIAICWSAVFIAAVSCSAAAPAVVAYDGFDYSAGEYLSGQSGGTGWNDNWHTTYYDGDLQVISPGYTYTDLSTVGNRIGFGTAGTVGISQSYRSFDRLSSGKAYVQCLFQSSATGTGGTPQLRIQDGSGTVISLGPSDSFPNNISLITGLGEAATTALASDLNMLLLLIDYDSTTAKLWVNPDLSAFDYENPPTLADAEITSAMSGIDGLSVYFRNGSYIDEIKVMSIPEPATMAIIAAGGAILLRRRK